MTLYNFWHSYGTDLQNGAVVLSAVAAFLVVRDGRRIAKRRGTLDLIFEQEKDRELIEARNDFVAIKASNVKTSTYGADDQRSSKEAKAIRKVLNLHELTAVAISEGVIDERVYRKWFNKTFIDDYRCTVDYINNVRVARNNPKIFYVYEEMAKRWEVDPTWYADPNWAQRKWMAFVRLWWA